MKEKLFELFVDSTIIQSAITMMLVATMLYLIVVGREVPDILANLTMSVVGFWFGQKVQLGARRLAEVQREPGDSAHHH